MVLAFVKDVSAFLEVAIGILLGLWGIQSVLVPIDITEPTITPQIILALYVLLAFAVFIRFVIRPCWNWANIRFKEK